MKKSDVWEFILQHVSNQTAVILLSVVASHGASPGRAGFKLAIAADGTHCGTIGGGVMEVNWMDESLQLLAGNSPKPHVRTIFHSKETQHEPSGLICSGSQTMLRMPLHAGDRDTIERIVRLFDKRQYGLLRMTPRGLALLTGEKNPKDIVFALTNERDWLYEENIGVLDTVYIVGSGHVGLALSRVMTTLDFRVVVVDDRTDVATFVQNCFAHEKIAANYSALESIVAGNEREYAAVVTTAYKSDEEALRVLLKKNVRYIGLMGSAAKTKQIFDDLRKEGIAGSDLHRIHTPIGLSIASHTPEEIAVSIAAEIIQVKNRTLS
jgi:xanthine dehydrogenase accessory factor